MGAAEAVGQLVEALLQAAGLFHDQGRGLHGMPVLLAVGAQIGIGIVLAVDAPHDLVLAEALAVNDQVAGTDLAEVHAAIVGQADLELEADDLAVFFDVATINAAALPNPLVRSTLYNL